MRADPTRLVAVATGCRAEHLRRVTVAPPTQENPAPDTAVYATAARLAELGLEILRRTGADRDLTARATLLVELDQEHFHQEQGVQPHSWRHSWRHSWSRRLLRRLDPFWWIRRLHTARNVAFSTGPRRGDADLRELRIWVNDQQVGCLVFQICHWCRIGYVVNISVNEAYRGRGIATRALRAIRVGIADYRWSTSAQHEPAITFWLRMARRFRVGYQAADPCEHIRP